MHTHGLRNVGTHVAHRQGCHATRHGQYQPCIHACGWRCIAVLAHFTAVQARTHALARHFGDERSRITGTGGNQCCFTIGLSITTSSNASIVTTSLPIFAMILSALILKEPITGKKALGVGIGCSGALILIMSSATAHDSRIGDIRGDLLCIFAQLSFALYLALYRDFLRRYSPITVSKWMFTWST